MYVKSSALHLHQFSGFLGISYFFEFVCLMYFCRRRQKWRSIRDGGSEARPPQASKRAKEEASVWA